MTIATLSEANKGNINGSSSGHNNCNDHRNDTTSPHSPSPPEEKGSLKPRNKQFPHGNTSSNTFERDKV
ncbi:hypothetical protein GBA52_024878 [Prunus armeniaca]|nr:hypothetical protein GBA52_024878 [Prunus armeniaca]